MSKAFDKLEKISNQGEKEKTDGKIRISTNTGTQNKQYSVYLRPEQSDTLEWLANKTGKDRSEIVRIALDYLFENFEIK